MRVLRRGMAATVIVTTICALGGSGLAAQSEASAPPWETCEPAVRRFSSEDIRLTGLWDGGDGAIYYIRQVGDRIFWHGLSDAAATSDHAPGRIWDNVAMGTIDESGLITLDWADVPRGNILGTGTLAVQAGPDGEGNLQLQVVDETGHFTDMSAARGWHARGESRDRVLTPCAPVTVATTLFNPALSFRDEAGVGLTVFDLGRVVELSAGDHAGDESGITIWSLSPGAAETCDGKADPTPEPGAQAFLVWLQSREDLLISEPMDVDVDGRPATMVDIRPVAGAKACLGDFDRLRLWKVTGADASLHMDSMARVILLDVDDQTLAIEMYGDDQEAWLPLAQEIANTIDFTD